MKNRILWIEDDYYAIKGLMKPLKSSGYKVDVATSAYEGFIKSKDWREYDLIVVDLILPIADDNAKLPNEVASWDDHENVGEGLVEYLKEVLNVQCPILILSITNGQPTKYISDKKNHLYTLSKRGLLPSKLKSEVFKILGIQENIDANPM